MNSISSKTVRAKEAAAYIGISYGKFLQLVREGMLPHVKAGNRILCRLSSLDKWLEDKESESTKF